MNVGSKQRARGSIRWTSSVAIAGLLAVAACGGKGPVDGGRAFAHVEKLVSFGPRPFGSDALGRAADYITGEVTKLGLSPKRQEVMDEKEKKLIRNLYVQIDGEDPVNGPILVIGAHYDTKLAAGHDKEEHNFPFVGAIDGGGAPAVLLELARVLQAQKPRPKVNVWLYWIDAEESVDFHWNDERALLGSKAFCRWLAADGTLKRVKAFVLLDLIGDRNCKIDRDGNSHKQLQDMFERAAKAIGEEARVYEFPSREEIAWYAQKGARWGITDDHKTFSDFGVPSVLLIDFSKRIPPHLQELPEGRKPDVDPRYAQWWHTPDDTLDKVSPEALAFAGNLVMAAFPELEGFCLPKK
jgi:Zn-dependent M28 family amino/carboxypeptidase